MAKPGNDPQDQQKIAESVQEKLNSFYSSLNDDERNYVQTRMKQAVTVGATSSGSGLGISAPGISLAINNSNKPLVVKNIDPGSGWTISQLFDGPAPQVGDVIAPGNRYTFTWVEWFFGSNCDLYLEAQDGSGSIRTRTGMSIIGGWGYGCDSASGSLACSDPGTNPSSWDNNVEVINS
jgi:hypothetical protein